MDHRESPDESKVTNVMNRGAAVACALGAVLVLSGSVIVAGAAASRMPAGAANVAAAIARIEGAARYRQSDWGYQVVDQEQPQGTGRAERSKDV